MRHYVFITPGFPADESDSTCIPPLQGLVREIQELALAKITVITLHYPFYHKQYQWHGATVYACGGANRRWLRLFILQRAARTFRHIMQAERVDGIHSFWLNDSAVTGFMMAKKYRLPHWVTLMGQDVLPGNRFLNFFKRIKSSRQSVYWQTIALSDFHNRIFLETTGRESDHIIPWGLDIRCLPPFTTLQRTIDLLAVGSLIRLKNYEQFIQLIAELKKDSPDISCMLIGDGPERVHLEKMAQQAGLQHNLTFTGKLPRHEVIEIMMQAKVLIHPSRFESFGYVFFEALYAGMTLVTTPVGYSAPSPKWFVASQKADWPLLVREALQNRPDGQSFIPEDMRDTALAYQRLWFS